LQSFAYRHASHIVALSPDMKRGIVKRGYPEERITTIPNSSDTDVFAASAAEARAFRQEHDWLGNRPLVLYCGTLGRVNDVRYIVRLAELALTEERDVRFLLIGSGNEREKVKAAAIAAGVLDVNLFMWDRLPKERLGPVYAAATVAMSTVAPIQALWANS